MNTPLALTLIVVLTLLMPALSVWDYRRLLRKLREGRDEARLEAYVWTIGLQWSLLIVFLGWWLLSGGGYGPLRLVPAADGWQWLVIGAGGVGVAVMLTHMLSVLRSEEKQEEVLQQAGDLVALAPRTPAERRAFAGMSVTAGVCEEILYRGVLLALLTDLVGLWPAVLLSSGIFGLGHAYQGGAGIVKTGAVGIVMALLAVGTGSLFVPIVLHAVIDLASGRMLGAAAVSAGPRPAAARC